MKWRIVVKCKSDEDGRGVFFDCMILWEWLQQGNCELSCRESIDQRLAGF